MAAAAASSSSRRSLLHEVAHIIPPLTPSAHKGQAGRVGIVGGSADYTGAPFFASMSSMRLGADMSHTICEPSAGNVIKTYSPDLIVHRILDPQRSQKDIRGDLEGIFSRLHSLVVGPGLGRDEHMQSCGRTALQIAREKDIWTVIDADGLWLVSQEPEVVIGWNKVVLTPNVVEFGRLCEKMGVDAKKEPAQAAKQLATALKGPIILEKGPEDRISAGNDTLTVTDSGSLKRCGGQGDILSGSLGTFLAWAKIYNLASHPAFKESPSKSPPREDVQRLLMLAAYGAATITRHASRLAYENRGRSMLADDLIPFVGEAYEKLFAEEVQKAAETQ